MNIKLKIKKGDEVIVLAGKDKGKKGEVIEILRQKSKAKVTRFQGFVREYPQIVFGASRRKKANKVT